MAYTQAWQNQYQIANHVDVIRGDHQIGFGVDWARDDILSYSNTFGVGNMNVGPDRTGNAMGDFFLGYMTQIRQSMPGLLSPVQHYVGVYAQDTWRTTPRLTLNYGVRWEPFLPFGWVPSGPTGGVRVYSFTVDDFKAGKKSVVFPGAPAGLSYPSQNADGSGPADFDGASAIKRRLNQFAPRVGAALDPTGSGRSSIRAGYGLMYELVQLNVTRASNGTSPWAADLLHRLGTLANPWEGMPGGNPFPFDWRETPLFLPASVVLPFDPDLNTPYTHNWNVSLPAGARGPLARLGQLPGESRPAPVGDGSAESRAEPDAAVACEPVHRAEHLRPRGPDVHALQYGREPQSAAGAAALGERKRHDAAAPGHAARFEHRYVALGSFVDLSRAADVDPRRDRRREPQPQLHAVQVHERPHDARHRQPEQQSAQPGDDGPRAVQPGPPPHLQHDGDRQYACSSPTASCAPSPPTGSSR